VRQRQLGLHQTVHGTDRADREEAPSHSRVVVNERHNRGDEGEARDPAITQGLGQAVQVLLHGDSSFRLASGWDR